MYQHLSVGPKTAQLTLDENWIQITLTVHVTNVMG